MHHPDIDIGWPGRVFRSEKIAPYLAEVDKVPECAATGSLPLVSWFLVVHYP